MQLALAPLLHHQHHHSASLSSLPSVVFGVSGYSGAGTKPSDKNNPQHLHDNFIPYALTYHGHQKEVNFHMSRYLGKTTSIYFHPHVASFFRGISLTISVPLLETMTRTQLLDLFTRHYSHEPLINITEDIPLVKDSMSRHSVNIGGFYVDKAGGRCVITVTLDNLLKGAATQCVQNINLALGFEELQGVE